MRWALSAAPIDATDALAAAVPDDTALQAPDILAEPAAASPLSTGEAIGLVRDGALVQTRSSAQASDQERGDALRALLAQTQPGDEVFLGPYAFDMGDQAHVEFPAGVTVTGAGKELTRLSSGLRQWVDGAATFTLNDQTVVQDLWLEGTLYDGTYQTLVGMGYIPTNDITTYLKRVKITGDSDGIYIWANQNLDYRLYAYDCEISTRYDAVAVLGSNPYKEYVELWNSTLTVQQPSSIPMHESNCVNISTGQVKLVNCTLNATGDANSVQTAGIFARNLGYVEVINSTFNVSDPTGTAYDFLITGSARVVYSGGAGSGSEGAYTSNNGSELETTAANSAVVNRAVFYNNSAFDNTDPAPGVADGDAIATDKTPLLPGQAATFANYTNYTRGINGIIIDLAGPHGAISATDFEFKTSSSPQSGVWLDAPAPLSVTILGGEGTGNSERIEIIWPDGAVRNTWLQVTMLANNTTGLASPDVFVFGNLIGDTGGADGLLAVTNALDAAEVLSSLQPVASISSPYDFNRDGRITSTDLAAVRVFAGSQLWLADLDATTAELLSFGTLPQSAIGSVELNVEVASPLANADVATQATGLRPLLLTAQQANRMRFAPAALRASHDAAIADEDWWKLS